MFGISSHHLLFSSPCTSCFGVSSAAAPASSSSVRPQLLPPLRFAVHRVLQRFGHCVALGEIWPSHCSRDHVLWLVPPTHLRFPAHRLLRRTFTRSSSLFIGIANAVNEGKLVPEDIIFGLLSKRLEEGYCRGEIGFILDGIPRTRIQAEILDQIADIDLVVNFKCAEDCLVKKHSGSDICAYCGKIYDIYNTQSTRLNACLATRTSHSKLNPSASFDMDKSRMERLQLYSEQTKLLEDYYRKKNKLLDFHISEGPGETWRGLLSALHLQQAHAARLAQKLTA